MPKFAVIRTGSLKLKVREGAMPRRGIVIPLSVDVDEWDSEGGGHVGVIAGHVMTILYAAWRRRHPKMYPMLTPPDGWLVAVGAIMWEGIISGR